MANGLKSSKAELMWNDTGLGAGGSVYIAESYTGRSLERRSSARRLVHMFRRCCRRLTKYLRLNLLVAR
jgi:hypothetical protein